MNLLKKILRTVQNDNVPAASTEELRQIVAPLLKEANKIVADACSTPPDNSQFKSHFGGQPYFEIGEAWPESKAGKPLQLVCQIFNDEGLVLPDTVKLVQLFYDFNSGAKTTSDDGWLVKIYGGLDMDRTINLPKPEGLTEAAYCEVTFEQVKSLPDWEGIDSFSPEAVTISAVLNQEDQWEHYEKIAEELAGSPALRSQLGGYPKWLDEDATPEGNDNLELLLQINCEEQMGIMWGGSAVFYIFYDTGTKHTEFVFQYR